MHFCLFIKYIIMKMKIFNHFFQKIYKTITINYKTWLAFTVSAIILGGSNPFVSWISFFLIYIDTYVGHVLTHSEFFGHSVFSIPHVEHHKPNSGKLEFVINCMMEFISVTFFIFIYGINKEFEIVHLAFIDEWIILFMYFFYTILHNINYGIYRPNLYHFKHHENTQTNYTPDFFDLLCETKNQDTPEVENTDFYLPNILVSFIIVFILKQKYKSFSNIQPYFNIIWITAYCIIAVFALYTTIKNVSIAIDNERVFFDV